MKKISIYVFLLLNFLGISASFYPSESGIKYVPDETVFANYFPKENTSLILTDYFKTGFIIKSYFHRYRIIHSFNSADEQIFRVSKYFWEKNKKNIGMTIFLRQAKDVPVNIIPSPPGSQFVGNRAYGHWKLQDSGLRLWAFYSVYQHFPSMLSWGDFRPDQKFYNEMIMAQKNETPFYGTNKEFGTEGAVTLLNLPKKNVSEVVVLKALLKKRLQKFLSLPQEIY